MVELYEYSKIFLQFSYNFLSLCYTPIFKIMSRWIIRGDNENLYNVICDGTIILSLWRKAHWGNRLYGGMSVLESNSKSRLFKQSLAVV